ncbi:hypothetical protein QBC36DRAFT_193719 [Triangularia setosa]|uniref:Uncharacterized protein n=1 Tax=Triangularia setosa TaxID=2587417 RepID=A0AAN6W240_9PEZI|nr:hypothetical protein QBC36DRAFT_193719 [Podospora setosa]
MLVNLSIILLELCFGTALEEHETRRIYPRTEEITSTKTFLDMAAALGWSTQVAEEAGSEFSQAIDWYLKNMPGSGKSDGSPDRWRAELFERVVSPLKYCHDQMVGIEGQVPGYSELQKASTTRTTYEG